MPIQRHRVLVTEVTEYGDLRCVAGWDLDRQMMVRPEPGPGEFWSAAMAGRGGPFRVGAVVGFPGKRPEPATAYPHFTEDRVVTGLVTPSLVILSAAELAKTLTATISASIQDIFGGHVQVARMSAFVTEGTQCRSLGAIEVSASLVTIYEDTDWDKKRLRCTIRTGTSVLRPSITSLALRELYREGGVQAVQSSLQPASRLHLRIGLARAFSGQPEKCYVQVNGIEIAP